MRYVTRYQNTPTLDRQNIADHSFFVSLYAKLFCDVLSVSDKNRAEVLDYAVLHDLGEAISFDIPANVKRFTGQHSREIENIANVEMFNGHHEIKTKYSSLSILLVKLADLLDCVMYAQEQISLGNRFFIPVLPEVSDALISSLVGIKKQISIVKYKRLHRFITMQVNNLRSTPGEAYPQHPTPTMTHIHKEL